MDWESFLSFVEDGDVIPVIGNELSLVKKEGGTAVSLSRYITTELGREYGETDVDGQNLHELALKHKDKNFYLKALSIYKKIEPDCLVTEPMKKLAGIIDFKYYISACVDDLLVNAIREVRNYKGNELKIINHSLEPPRAKDHNAEEEEPQVTVLNLLGTEKAQTTDSPKLSTIDEEELLEHFFSIATKKIHSKDIADFIEKMKEKVLLFIGCDFPDWFMRFIIRVLADERFTNKIVYNYIVPEQPDLCPKLRQFLEHFKENIVVMDDARAGNVAAFVNELYKRWVKHINKIPIKYEGTVFLSYNHRDRDKVAYFKKHLRARGIKDVWFDVEKLKSGEHRPEIEKEITACKVFIPMISNNCLEHRDSYTWTVEWKKIENRLKADRVYAKLTFQLIPCILDETSNKDERIPPFMRDFVIWELEKNEEKIADEIVKHLTPIEAHAKRQD